MSVLLLEVMIALVWDCTHQTGGPLGSPKSGEFGSKMHFSDPGNRVFFLHFLKKAAKKLGFGGKKRKKSAGFWGKNRKGKKKSVENRVKNGGGVS